MEQECIHIINNYFVVERRIAMKETYEKAEMEVIVFESEDIITSSDGDTNTPWVP